MGQTYTYLEPGRCPNSLFYPIYTESNYTALEESQNQKYQATSYDSYGSNTNRGSYFSISPEGEKIMLPWTADKNGFQASG
ncbi:hypothetical protein OUZ56_020460 [Daphnia magna]|uniref:Uncharacterized protein n=1 Tax=Daphnia magna TaxID=35525 RepID=A0ABQ9ZET4_9CRUS|nr:hypothetical protein OUZ56_020460 [Daphnia magna]